MQDVLLSAADSFFSTFAGYIPSILGAIVIFVLGLFVATALRGTTKKILDWTGFSNATDKTDLNESLQKVGIKKTLSSIIAGIVYWIIFLVFLTAAFEILGLQIVVITLNNLIAYLPNVIIAAITIVLTLLLGRLVKKLITIGLEQLNISFSKIAATIAEAFTILFGASIAISQLGLDITIITANITIIVGGIMAILVLSLGLGSRNAAANVINSYYTKQLFKKGTVVNLSGHKGRVKETNSVAVVLETDNGEVIIPNEEALKRGSVTAK
jgi:hypothetical protein